MPEYLTIPEVCTLLRLAEKTVYTMCREGRLPGAVKVGNQWRVEHEKLRAWLDAGGAKESPKRGAERE